MKISSTRGRSKIARNFLVVNSRMPERIDTLTDQIRTFGFGALLAISLGVPAVTSASVLSDLAASLPEKTWTKMPSNSSLSSLGLENTLTTYANTGVWDPVNDRLMWAGGPGGCCVQNPVFKLITYDAGADTWAIRNTPYSGSGHAYDGNAFDPGTGRFFFKHWRSPDLKIWNGSSWSSAPNLPWEKPATAVVWFPDINNGNGALVYVGQDESDGQGGRLAWLDGSTWRKIQQGQRWGKVHTFAEYNPVHKVVWLGSGSENDRAIYKLDAQLNVTRLSDAPFNLQSSESGAMSVVDPATGLYIVYNRSSKDWWQYDIIADQWTRITDMINKPPQFWNNFAVPIPEYGVILVFEHKNGQVDETAYLYKHAPSEADTLAPTAPDAVVIVE